MELGAASSEYQDDHLRRPTSSRIECDELWAFCHSKAKNVPDEHQDEFGWGDVWTWTSIDPDSKLMPAWRIGQRDAIDCQAFLLDLASRLSYRVQLTTDGHKPYLAAVEEAFGSEVDYAMLVKYYGIDPNEDRKFSPPVVLRKCGSSREIPTRPRSARAMSSGPT